MAVKLSEQGHYTWKEWAAALADQLQAAEKRGEPDDGSRYYEHWLAALESLVAAKGLADPRALHARKEAWAAAYRNTPHGQPVELLRSRAPDARWLLVGLVCTFGTYWMFQQVSVESFAASAGLGALLGMRHALEPDHLAAVSTLMTGERSSAKAAWLGAFWGLGHTLTLFIAGALLVLLQTEMPPIARRCCRCAWSCCSSALACARFITAHGACLRVRRIPIGPRERRHHFKWTDGPSRGHSWSELSMAWRAAAR